MVALTMKNWFLFQRNWCFSALLLLAPVFFVIVFGSFYATAAGGVVLHPAPFATFSSATTPIPKCAVFAAQGSRFGLGNAIPSAACVTLVYSPNTNAEVVNIMATASQNNSLSHVTNAPQGSSINTYASTADVVGFPSRAELTAFLTSTGFGRTGATVVFNDTVASNMLLPNGI
jgi:hypothetical protein